MESRHKGRPAAATRYLALLVLAVTAASAQDAGVSLVGFTGRLSPGQLGWTELMDATVDGDLLRVDELIAQGVDVNAVSDNGSSALIVATSGGQLEIARRLLDAGADPNIQDGRGDSALGMALTWRHPAIALELIAANANPNSGFEDEERSALEMAAVHGYTEVIAALIGAGADLTRYGPGALRAGVWKGDIDVVRLLMASGVDVNAPADRSALSIAISEENADLVQLLLGQGAAVNYTDLQAAVARRRPDIATQLFRQFDPTSLLPAQQDDFLALADRAGEQQIVVDFYQSSPQLARMARRERLLYTSRISDGCSVSLWDPSLSAEPRELDAGTACPARVFVAEDAGVVFVLRGSQVRSIALDGADTDEFELPLAEARRAVEDLQARWRQMGRPGIAGLEPETAAVGLIGEEIGIAFSVSDASDGTVVLLFSRRPDGWSLSEEISCDRFVVVCSSAELDGRPIDLWPAEQSVWHPHLRLSPYFLGKESAPAPGSYDEINGTVQLAIDGRVVTLRYSAAHGSDTERVYTTYLEAQIDAGEPTPLLRRYAEAALAGPYLLTGSEYAMPYELIELGTRESVLGPMLAATWIR